jgi:hypothetical protein
MDFLLTETRHALSPLLSNFTSEYATGKLQVNKERLEMNGAHQILAYADDVHLWGENTNIKKSTETFIR